TCDPFAAELFKAKAGNEKQQQPVPSLCNSTDSKSSHSSKQSTSSFCSTVWSTCRDTSISNSPFAPSLQGGAKGSASITSNMSTLTDLWQSEKTFCNVFGSPPSDNTSVCFAGEPIKLTNTSSETDDAPPKGLYLEKIGLPTLSVEMLGSAMLVVETTLPALGYMYSFAQDNKKDVFILANNGVYRVVRPSRCNYACSKEIVRPATGPSQSPSPASAALSIAPLKEWLLLFLSFLILQCLYN
ncbi:HIPL1 protein, partial [Bienertia sinuspersici]